MGFGKLQRPNVELGPTRNLTVTFAKARDEARSKRSGQGGSRFRRPRDTRSGEDAGRAALLAGGGEASQVEMIAMPPQWVAVLAEGQEILATAAEKLEALQRAQQKRKLDVFSNDRDRDIEDMSQTVAGLIKQCESRVQQMSLRGSDAGMTKRELQVRQNAQRGLAQQLQELSMRFRKQQKSFLNTLEKRDGGSQWLEVGDDEPIEDFGFTNSQLIELEDSEHVVEQRSEQITKIAQSVQELHTIFKELAVLVIDQGTVLDRIDYNIEQVAIKSREATVQLEKADKIQRSTRSLKCIMCLVVTIFVLLVIITMQHAARRRLLAVSDIHI